MIALVLVALGSGIGAPLRYLVDREVQYRTGGEFPLGTMLINVSGSFLLGVLVGAGRHVGVSDLAVTALGTGLLGAFTTFSTLMWETGRLLEEGSYRDAVVNVVASVAVGLAAAGLGFALADAA